jgi:hypothetical protein
VTTPALAVGLALAIALVAGGAVTAFVSANAVKKISATLTCLVGAGLTLALLGAPSSAVIAVVAIALGYAAIGVAITVRLQEAYGGIEASDLDAADEHDEPREPET